MESMQERKRRLNRERVARWKARHPYEAREREIARRERIKAGLALLAGVGKALPPAPRKALRAANEKVQETHYEDLEGVDRGYDDARGRNNHGVAGGIDRRGALEGSDIGIGREVGRGKDAEGGISELGRESGVRGWDAPGSCTDHELWVRDEAERFKAKRAERDIRGGPGVEVDMGS